MKGAVDQNHSGCGEIFKNLYNPSNNDIPSTRSLTFDWSDVSSATYYKIHINRNGNYYTSNWTQSTSWTPPGVTCETAPAAAGIVFAADSFYHKATEEPNVGSTPSLDVNFYGVPWVQIYINNAATGKVIYNKWIHFTEIESFNENMPKLPPGDYEFWTRSYHHSCGTGPWSEAPWLTWTVVPVEPESVIIYEVRSDQRGVTYSPFRVKPGIDWYQIYVTSGTKVVLNQWFDVEKEWTDPAGVGEKADGVYPAYAPLRIGDDYLLKLSQAYGGPMTVWIRSFSNSGAYSEWTEEPSHQGALFTGTAPVDLESSSVAVNWEYYSQNFGQYELYFQRNAEDAATVIDWTGLAARSSPV